MPELVLKLGENVVQTYVFDKDIMGVGRSRDNDVVIENLSVSRNHARIRNQGGKFVLTDLNSANGTYVNGVKVTKTEIVDGDVITVGKHKLHFANKLVSEEEKIVDAFGQDRTMFVDRAPQPVLCVTEGKIKGTEFPISKFETAIGKAQENDIVIGDDWFLSKKQAVIYKKGLEYELHDLGGFRKTKVNGQPLNEPHLLRPGDVIELGNTKCVFQFAGEPAPSGRVPQEMAPEDSIFSTGGGLDPIPVLQTTPSQANPATERDESAESYAVVVEGLPEEAAAPAPVEEQPEPVSEVAQEAGAEAAVEEEEAPAPVEEVAAVALVDPAGETVAAKPAGGSGSQRRRKKDRLRDAAAAAQKGSNGSAYGAESAEPPAVEPPPVETAPAEVPAEQPVYHEAQNADSELPDGPLRWSGQGMSDEEVAANADLHKEVLIWETAMRNRSAVIRRQAARTLKKLTGRDYEI